MVPILRIIGVKLYATFQRAKSHLCRLKLKLLKALDENKDDDDMFYFVYFFGYSVLFETICISIGKMSCCKKYSKLLK